MIRTLEIPEEFPKTSNEMEYRVEFNTGVTEISINRASFDVWEVFMFYPPEHYITLFNVKTERRDTSVLKFVKSQLAGLPISDMYNTCIQYRDELEIMKALVHDISSLHLRRLDIWNLDNPEYDKTYEEMYINLYNGMKKLESYLDPEN